MTQVWAHNIVLEHLDEVDTDFNKYLKTQVGSSGYTAEIVSRKVTCTPSNSCFLALASQSAVELKAKKLPKEVYKVENPLHSLNIQNLPSNRLTCLVFRVIYKVKYSQKGCKDVIRDFVLGRAPFFLNFDLMYSSGFIKDREIEVTLSMCPELSIINDLLWDVNQTKNTAVDLVIKLKMHLSNCPDLKTEQEQQKLENEFIENEIAKQKKNEILDKVNKDGGAGSIAVDQETLKRMAQLEIENQRLKEANMKIEKQREQEAREAQMLSGKQTVSQSDAKEKSQPSVGEAEKVTPEIKPSSTSPKPSSITSSPATSFTENRMLDVLLGRDDTDVQKLLELLQKLLDKTQEHQQQYKGVISKL